MTHKPVVLIALPLATALRETLEQYYEVHSLEHDKENVLTQYGAHARGLLTSALQIVDRALLDRLPQLEIVACSGVGVDAIDLDCAKERGLAVTNTPAVLDEAVANLAMALILALTRNVIVGDHFVRSGAWLKGRLPLGHDIAGKMCGIVGLGGIGQAVAQRASVFGMHVCYYGRKPKETPYHYYDDLEAMAAVSDILVLAVPGTSETHHLIDASILKALGPNGYLVNVARGSVVDQAALITALQEKSIAGAGLDVFSNEPHVPAELIAMNNVILLPHIGSGTYETRTAMARLAIDNLTAFFAGKPLLTRVV